MDAPRIAVVDYHKGNLSSVVRGLARAGAAAYATDNPDEIRSAEGLVLPGVGSFYDAIAYMSESGQDRAVTDAVANGAPFLGICLGQQLLFERGDEGVPVAGDNEVSDGGAVAADDRDKIAVFQRQIEVVNRTLLIDRSGVERLVNTLEFEHISGPPSWS